MMALGGGSVWWWRHSRTPAPTVTKGEFVLLAEGLPQEQQWRQDFVFADMDGDGLRDLVTAPPRKGQEGRPYIFLRRRDGWQQACADTMRGGFPLSDYFYGGVAVADFDGNKIPAIAIAMHEIGIRIFRSQQPGPCGPWEERRDLPDVMTHMPSRAIVAADMNRDGRIDLVALSEAPGLDKNLMTTGVVIFWNDPAGWRAQTLPGSAGLFGDDVAVGEVNGDGVPDIAVGNLDGGRREFAWLSDGAGGWRAETDGLPELTLGWSVQLVDLDGDGSDDLLLGAGGPPSNENAGPRAYRWDGKRWHGLSQGLPQVSWVVGVAAADLDGDGTAEIIAAGMHTGVVHVYGRQADGAWSERHTLTVPNGEGLRNYKVRAVSDDALKQGLVVANYAGESGGKILAWTWRRE